MRILLIEDDRALCTALLPALQAAGYTVDTCHDGADGKALLCGGAYDVCVLDRMLPGLDGLSLLRAARAKGCTTPVLMLTALSGINDRVDGLDAGAVLFQVILVGAFHDNGCIVGSGKVQETGKQGFFAEIAAVLRILAETVDIQFLRFTDDLTDTVFLTEFLRFLQFSRREGTGTCGDCDHIVSAKSFQCCFQKESRIYTA